MILRPRRALLKALREVKLPLETRRSVRTSDADNKAGAVIGAVIQYYKSCWTVGKFTRKHPELAAIACQYAKNFFPHFKFSSVMINKGSSALHVDRMNLGPSVIVSLGDHTGGELWQYPDRVIKIRNKPKLTDGLLPHMTLPYKGERFSLVYFNMYGNRSPLSREDAVFLRSLGFHSVVNNPTSKPLPRADLLDEAAFTLHKRGISRRAIGDYKNNHIKTRRSVRKSQ